MSPKPTTRLISLEHAGLGLAGHYLWEKEVLCDYIAVRIGYLSVDILEECEANGITHPNSYKELLKIAKALRKHPSAGLHSKIDLKDTFHDIRDFVQWDKEELADYMVHRIIALGLGSLFENEPMHRSFAMEIQSLAFAVYSEKPGDGLQDAEEEAAQGRKMRDYYRARVAAREKTAREERGANGSAEMPSGVTDSSPPRSRSVAKTARA